MGVTTGACGYQGVCMALGETVHFFCPQAARSCREQARRTCSSACPDGRARITGASLPGHPYTIVRISTYACACMRAGDVTINPNASCLVMTTEIFRSMLYRGSEVRHGGPGAGCDWLPAGRQPRVVAARAPAPAHVGVRLHALGRGLEGVGGWVRGWAGGRAGFAK